MNALKLSTISTVLTLLLFTEIGRADGLDTWTLRNPEPTGNDLHGIVYGNSQFVAVGAGGVILTSPDGVNWTPRQAPTLSALSGIAYGNGQFVAVGDAGAIVTSPDGVNWVQRVSGTQIALPAVAYGNGQFVVVGNGYNTTTQQSEDITVTSANGADWVQHQSGTTNGFIGIAYGNDVFVAVGSSPQSTIMSSADGVDWVRRQMVTPDDGLASIAYGNGQFVAVSYPNGHNSFVLTSADGVNWSLVLFPGVANLYGLSYGNGLFVGTLDGDLASSTDGVTWGYRPSGIPWDDHYTAELYSTVFGNGQFVAVGAFGTVVTSSDGVKWVRREPRELIVLSDIAYGSGQFVAVGDWYNTATSGWEAISETSADGFAWAQSHVEPETSFNNVAQGNGQFVASGYWSNALSGLQGNIFTSTNGMNWIPRLSGTTNGLGAIAYGNGQFVVVGDTGIIMTSPDGTNWNQRQSGTQSAPSATTYGNGQFVAVGSHRVSPYWYTTFSLTSRDGVDWVQLQDNSSAILRGVAYGNSQFVEVGLGENIDYNVIIRHSTDGLNWVYDDEPETPWFSLLTGVAYGSGHFVAVGGEPIHVLGFGDVHGRLIVFTSADGVSWARRSVPGLQISPSAIAYGNSHFVAVGQYGTILQSGNIINLAVTRSPNTGLLSLSLEGPTGLAYAIESSTDLISWRNLTNITSVQPSTIVFEAPPIAGERAFYRAYSQ